MKKFSLALITMSVLAASGASFAAEPPPKATEGGKGLISFTGNINNDACSVDNALGADKTVSIDMGTVSIKDMGTDSDPTAGRISPSNFDLKVNCNDGTKVTMLFQPEKGGSGLVTGKNALKLEKVINGAEGVGIALMNSDGSTITLANKPLIESNLVNGDASLRFAAAYVLIGDPKAAKGGVANASVPFTLMYE